MKNCKGFTLIEMAIVTVIFGLLLGGIMGPLKMHRDNLRSNETKQSMETIKQAIMGFAIRNGRIPCPDTDVLPKPDGLENIGVTTCNSSRGTVPWATLGVTASLDGWKQPFTYRVDTQFADIPPGTTGCPDLNGTGMSFVICSAGNINVFDSNGGNTVATDIPAIIVSHGSNQSTTGGDADEQENNNNNTNFVNKTHINQGYDDYVDWVNLNNLVAKMVSANKLP
jgi:prepilin-type N-terminal cleavage/methylation domain-containing protein